jgi:hypothetical protein
MSDKTKNDLHKTGCRRYRDINKEAFPGTAARAVGPSDPRRGDSQSHVDDVSAGTSEVLTWRSFSTNPAREAANSGPADGTSGMSWGLLEANPASAALSARSVTEASPVLKTMEVIRANPQGRLGCACRRSGARQDARQ